ncbi:MAG: SDR family NAD(P)-dependent oxidoreductase [Myxococcota bacterium]
MPSLNLRNKSCLVTGASSGIGAAMARALANAGPRLTLVARRRERLEQVAASLPGATEVKVVVADLRSESARAEVAQACPSPDVVILNAGVSQRAPVAEMDIHMLRSIMELNFFSATDLTFRFLPGMLERNFGHFVVISSVVGYVSTPLRSGYAASKHALHGFYEALRAETAGTGVGVTMAVPGYVRTEVGQQALRPDGPANHPVEPRGMDPDRAAHQIVEALKRMAPEVYVGGTELAAIYLRRFVPALVRRFGPRWAPED